MIEPVDDHHRSVKSPKVTVRAAVGPAADASAAVSSADAATAVSRLHAELDGIIERPVSDTACREAMLDCLLRCRSLMGGVWHHVNSTDATADVVRLHGPVFERDDVQRWLAALAGRAFTERNDLVVACPQVRNLKAICVPVIADRRMTPRPANVAADSLTPDRPSLVLTVLVTSDPPRSDETELLAVQCVVRAWRDWLETTQRRQFADRLLVTSLLLELAGRITSTEGLQSACQTLVNELQQYFEARFVAVGVRQKNRITTRLAAVSGIGDFDRNSRQTARLEATLNETLVRNAVTAYPAITEADRHQHLAHKRSAESAGVEAVISIPLVDGDESVVGVVTIGGSARRLLTPETQNILTAASQPLGTALHVVQESEGGLFRRTLNRCGKVVRSSRGVIMGLTVVAVVMVMLIPYPYRISCRCTLEPVERRYSLAPYDGLLETTFVEPGDRVTTGQLIGRMEGRELRWELAGLAAEEQRAIKERDVSMAALAAADSLMSEMEIEKLHARESLLEYRRDNLELRSPVDGIVLSGSLDKRENYPVTVGQVLYEIAPLDPIRIEVGVPAEEIPHIAKGMTVEVRLDGEDGDALTGKIARIQPRSEIRNEQNVFVAEVIVANPDGDLKPGMDGTARVTAKEHAIGWNIGHRAWERLMTKIWW